MLCQEIPRHRRHLLCEQIPVHTVLRFVFVRKVLNRKVLIRKFLVPALHVSLAMRRP